jgi:hypothetical protein
MRLFNFPSIVTSFLLQAALNREILFQQRAPVSVLGYCSAKEAIARTALSKG